LTAVSRSPLDRGELVEHWTLVPAEQDLVAAKHGETRLGFVLLLRFYGRYGRFPRGRADLRPEVVEFVARQVKAEPSDLALYEWEGRRIKRHRAEIRRFFGFREFTVADADKLTDWLAGDFGQRERRPDLVREQSWRNAERGSWSGPRRGRSTGSSAAR